MTTVRQISVFLENRPGRLARVTGLLGENRISIRALTIADTSDFGILRLIVDRPEEAFQVLKQAGIPVSSTEVVVIEIPDVPGGLAAPLECLKNAKINVEYIYAFLTKISESAFVVLSIDNAEEAINILQEKGIRVISANEIAEK